MLDLNHKYEGFGNQAFQKRTKSSMFPSKENINRTYHPTGKYRNATTPNSSVGIKKRIALQKSHYSADLKNTKKKRKKTNVFSQKCSRPSPINKEIEEIENSICLLTKKLEDRRRNSDSNTPSDNYRSEQIFPELYSSASSSNYKLKNNHKDFSKRKSGMKTMEVRSSYIQRCSYEQERSRLKSNSEPIKTLNTANVTGTLSVPNKKSFQNGISSRKMKKMHDRLDRVREFIRSINAMEIRTFSDGINHKDSPQKKNSSNDPSEGTDMAGNDHYRTIQQIVKSRRIFNRNRVFASRPPLLETVIEEPEKEEEEAKLYEML
ncbi:unnamed protein product [Nezara viridula]|uniref:Uncharacterized protein n=1 Tax=Nezara viridula TaxID=85310 RepID=A0A9P0H574_NEZVI|nr:unnamed protein product [Nezara viridula]